MSAARPDTWMPIYWGDYMRDTSHLSATQHGAYLMLIAHYWSTGAPLPDADATLWRIARCDNVAQWKKLRPSIVGFFKVADGVWHHGRVDFELTKAQRNLDAWSTSGKKSAQRKAGEKPTEPRAPTQAPTQAPTAPPTHEPTQRKADTPPPPPPPPPPSTEPEDIPPPPPLDPARASPDLGGGGNLEIPIWMDRDNERQRARLLALVKGFKLGHDAAAALIDGAAPVVGVQRFVEIVAEQSAGGRDRDRLHVAIAEAVAAARPAQAKPASKPLNPKQITDRRKALERYRTGEPWNWPTLFGPPPDDPACALPAEMVAEWRESQARKSAA